jgi:hypothetical protein
MKRCAIFLALLIITLVIAVLTEDKKGITLAEEITMNDAIDKTLVE